MNKIKIFSLALLLGVTVACDDFLDQHPSDSLLAEQGMQTLNDCQEVSVGIYSAFKNSALYSGSLTLLPDLQTDLVQAVQGYSNVYGEVYRWDLQPNSSEVEAVFSGLYLIINRCNYFMKYKDRVYEKLVSDSDKLTFNRRLADVYFARALAYSELIKTFCEAYDPQSADNQLGVSINLEYAPDKDLVIKRSSLKASYEQVLADLAQSEKLMTRVAGVNESAGRQYFSVGVVSALKARVYLYMEEYKLAVDYASRVIDATQSYALCDAYTTQTNAATGTLTTEYGYMWQYDRGNEIIWKIAMSNTDRGGALGKIFQGYNTSAYYPDYVPASWVLDLYSNYDGRYNTFFKQVKTGYTHGLEWPLLMKYPGNPEIDNGGERLFTNMPKPFRLAEQYLIRAEAYYNLGNESMAQQDLTTLRKSRIAGYGSTGASGNALLQEIQEERVRELCMEGFRLADLKRWKKGFARVPQLFTVGGAKNNALKVNASDKLFTWPIPKHEIEAGNGVVEGNMSNN